MQAKESVIETPRLELHHIAGDRLIDLFEKRDDAFALQGEPFTNPLRVLIDFQGPLAWRVPQVKEDSSVNKWFVRWIVLKEKSEALLGMWRWALTFPEVKTLRYTVSPENLPSIAVIKYFGFNFMGQQMDEIDGPEDIYEMDRESFLQRWGSK